MFLPILQKADSNDFKNFIQFWSKLYYYPSELENHYAETISKEIFDESDIQRLFLWKNRMTLSIKKQICLEKKVKSKLDLINFMKSNDEWQISYFIENFDNLTAVWEFFLLHIIKPKKYPIYDQHVHRAFNFINGLSIIGISANTITNKEKKEFYLNKYLPFISNLNGHNLKTVDEALFAFGQFLRTNRNALLLM